MNSMQKFLTWRQGSRGSVSIFLLIAALIMALVGQLMLLWCREELVRTRAYLFQQQLRYLNGSCYSMLKDMDVEDGSKTIYRGVLQPGNAEVEVVVKKTTSSDGLLHFLEVTSTSANQDGALQRLCRLKLDFAAAQKNLGGSMALASKKVTGLENISQEAVYTQASDEEVKLPELQFFYLKAVNSITTTDAVSEGLSRRFIYLDANNTFQFKANSVIGGASAFANKGSIEIGNGAHFPERLALYSRNGNITIGDNVKLDKALVHAYGTVTIGTGCKINGLVLANNIVLKGDSRFMADADVVAPFASVAYINQ